MVLDPRGRPVRKFVGEGHCEELIEFVQIAEEIFKELGMKENGNTKIIQLLESNSALYCRRGGD